MTDNLRVVLQSQWYTLANRRSIEGLHDKATYWLHDNMPGINFLLSRSMDERPAPAPSTRKEFRDVFTFTFFEEEHAILFKLAMT